MPKQYEKYDIHSVFQIQIYDIGPDYNHLKEGVLIDITYREVMRVDRYGPMPKAVADQFLPDLIKQLAELVDRTAQEHSIFKA